MFIIVQNTVKQIVISIFDQISQRCLVGSTQSWTNASSDDGFKQLAVVGGGKAAPCPGGVRELSNNDSFEYHVDRVLRDAMRTEYAQRMNTLCRLCTWSYNVRLFEIFMPSILIVVTRLMLGSGGVGIWIQRLCLLFVNTFSNDLVWLSFRILEICDHASTLDISSILVSTCNIRWLYCTVQQRILPCPVPYRHLYSF